MAYAMTKGNVLVFGATGMQGRGVLKALSPDYHVYAVTRDPSSPAARTITARPNVTLVQFDDNVSRMLARVPSLAGAFVVQAAAGQNDEVQEAKNIIDALAAHDVKHVVYSGVDRCNLDPTGIPFKKEIEEYIIDSSLRYTILRPTRFMDNWVRDGMRPVVMCEVDPDVKYQLISGYDVGRITRRAIEDSDGYHGQKIKLASQELTVREAADVYDRAMGKEEKLLGLGDLPEAYHFLIKFNATVPFTANIAENLAQHPFMQDFQGFLNEYKSDQA